MFLFLTRWLAYLLLTFGLVLLFFPLNTHRMEEIEKNFVFLKISETLVQGKRRTLPIITGTSDDKAMLELTKQLEKMQKLFSEETTAINTYGYPVIEPDDLSSFPFLESEVEDMMRRIALQQYEYTRSTRLDDVPVGEWDNFRNARLSGNDLFQYGNRIFKGEIRLDNVLADVEVKNLDTALKVLGSIFLVLGLFLLRGLYVFASTSSIQIGKPIIMYVWDLITIGMGTLFTFALIDAMLVKYFQTVSVLGDDEMALFMGLFWIVLANPVMALFVTATAVQTVWITEEGITVKSLFSRKFIRWSDVKNIKVSEHFIARNVYDVFSLRKVMKVLEIEGNTSTLYIMEPPLDSTKEEILSLLTRYAPMAFTNTISGSSRVWQSVL